MGKGVEIDTKAFNDGILRLVGHCDKGDLLKALEKAAAFLIGKAMDHAPKDTGTLAGSGTWKKTGPAEVTFGFNTEYALKQDVGGPGLPCKGYNSPIGPNLYFSGTLERFSETAMRIIADEVAKTLKS